MPTAIIKPNKTTIFTVNPDKAKTKILRVSHFPMYTLRATPAIKGVIKRWAYHPNWANKKSGDKLGCVDLTDVENFFSKVQSLMGDKERKQFEVIDEMEYLTDGYFKRKDQTDVTKNIRSGKRDTTKKYKND